MYPDESKGSVEHSVLSLAAQHCLSTVFFGACTQVHLCWLVVTTTLHGQDGESQATAKWASDLAFRAVDQHVEGKCTLAHVCYLHKKYSTVWSSSVCGSGTAGLFQA